MPNAPSRLWECRGVRLRCEGENVAIRSVEDNSSYALRPAVNADDHAARHRAGFVSSCADML